MVNYSSYQEAIFAWQADPSNRGRNLIVDAMAGSGKSTTAKELARRSGVDTLLLAFNKDIAKSLAQWAKSSKLDTRVDARTVHGLGYKALCQYYSERESRRIYRLPEPSDYKHYLVIRDQLEARGVQKFGKHVGPLKQMVKMVMNNLTDYNDREALIDLAVTYNVGEFLSNVDLYSEVIPVIMAQSAWEAAANKRITYEEMVYLPLVWDLPVPQASLVIMDEAQDTSEARYQLAKKACKPGGQMIFVGDRKQAIYLFAGARSNALDTIKEQMQADELSLPVSYRSSKTVIEWAKTLNPKIEAAPDAEEGGVFQVVEEELLDHLTVGDAVLCRTNAPLVATAFRLIMAGKPCRMLGREIGEGLQKLLTEMKEAITHMDMANFPDTLESFYNYKSQAWAERKNANALNAMLRDELDTLQAVWEGICQQNDGEWPPAGTVDHISQWLEYLFADKADGNKIILSSIHKSKGLEWDRVFLLRPESIPHSMAKTAEQLEQEENLLYVAYTRAKMYLILAPMVADTAVEGEGWEEEGEAAEDEEAA